MTFYAFPPTEHSPTKRKQPKNPPRKQEEEDERKERKKEEEKEKKKLSTHQRLNRLERMISTLREIVMQLQKSKTNHD